MKRTFTTLLSLIFLGLAAGAQTLTFSPAKSVSHQITSSDFEDITINVGLQVAADVTFEWNLIENTLPNTWSYSLCDLGHCFFEIPNSSTMEPLTKEQQDNGEQAFFKITVQTGEENYGKGVVRMYVYDKANMNAGDTVTFELEFAEPNSFQTVLTNGFQVYPNPNNGNFTITSLEDQPLSYILINCHGQHVHHGSDAEVKLNGLSEGVYFLKIIQTKGPLITQKILIQ